MQPIGRVGSGVAHPGPAGLVEAELSAPPATRWRSEEQEPRRGDSGAIETTLIVLAPPRAGCLGL